MRSFYEDSTILPGESITDPLTNPRVGSGTLQVSCSFRSESTVVRSSDVETFQPHPGGNLSGKVGQVSGRPRINLSSSPNHMLSSVE